MEYRKLYTDLSNLSEEIRQGAFAPPKPVEDKGLMRRTRKIAEGEPKKNSAKVVASYFAEINNPENRMPTFDEAMKEQAEFTSKHIGTEHIAGGAPRGGENFTMGSPVRGPVGAAREALAAVESGGNYAAIGPEVKKGMYKGQHAIGKYQVMEGNIGPWTEAALGKRMTTREFLANPQAQDAVVEHQLQKSYKKYGTWEDAASVWFSGRPVGQAGNADDGYIAVPEYISRFQNAYANLTDSSLVRPRRN